jgi:hypothetical protein
MRVAVVTPYYNEPQDVLDRCVASVREQSHPCDHFMISDGAERNMPSYVHHVSLHGPHGDNGDVARGVGSMCAIGREYEAIAYLDADNWYRREHIQHMATLRDQTGAAVCTAGRTIHRRDGSLMWVDRSDSDGKRHVDTSCLFLSRAAFPVAALWALIPKHLAPICDRLVWQAIRCRGYTCAHDERPTVCFRTQYAVHYTGIGEEPPPDSKGRSVIRDPMAWWNACSEGTRLLFLLRGEALTDG